MTERAEPTEWQETKGESALTAGHEPRKTAVRAAAVAAASGATALAAKKAFSRRESSPDDGQDAERKPARKANEALTSALTSSWNTARESLLPMLDDLARHAGEYVARNAPDIVSDKLLPQFIRGFEGEQKKSSDERAATTSSDA